MKLDRIVNAFYIPLLLIGIAGAINKLLITFTTNLNNKDVFIFDIVIIICILIFKFRKRIPVRKISFLLSLILIIWQIYIVFTCSGISTWDPGIILLTATEHFDKVWVNINQYFSTNPNTVPLLLFQHFIWILFNKPNLELFVNILGILNILLIDSSLILIKKSIQKMFESNTISNISTLFGIIIAGISPWMCIIYSDIFTFFLASAELFLLSLWKNKNKSKKILLSFILGIIAIIDLLVKPSAIIFFIGIIVISIFNLNKINFNKNIFIYAFTFIFTFLSLGVGYKIIQNNNSIVKINESEALPLSHFAAMGIQGNGGYSLKDVQFDNSIKDPKQRNMFAKKRWIKRYDDMGGFFGYEKFLVNKQSINLASGSMDWGHEGIFLTPFNQSKKIKSSLPRHLFTSVDGIAHGYYPAFFVIIQSFWCLGLILMLAAVFDKNIATQLLKIIFIGFCMFLLLFESGRSRYLIQFLPFIFVLMGIGYNQCKQFYKSKYGTQKINK